MNLDEFTKKVLGLIEEVNPNNENLTDDPDIATKFRETTNQVMFEMARFKKIPKYMEIPIHKGAILTFEDLEKECGYEIYQVKMVSGVGYAPKADGTVLKFIEDGTAEIEVYVYPERITETTKGKAYEFELTPDALEVMVYGVAADLLKSDVSTEYGAIYAQRFETMLARLDPRYQMTGISIEGGLMI